jgi:FkbM family methyltransferase
MRLSITNRRIKNFCSFLLEENNEAEKVGFVDVGSGGNLKEPWSLIPAEGISKFEFEPTGTKGVLPLCVSNKSGSAEFFVAVNERDSSFHQPRADFIGRYGFEEMLTKKVISVECTSLDEYFSGRYQSIDAMDINVEGHDFQVLQGASQLLDTGATKLIKVEFQLARVYEGQGNFSDIDSLLREKGFRLAGIQIDNVRPRKYKNIFFKGEPLWGKALYVPNIDELAKKFSLAKAENESIARREMAVGISLYMAAKLPSYAYDAIDAALAVGIISQSESLKLGMRIAECFRWAKIEEGLSGLRKVWISLCGSIRG